MQVYDLTGRAYAQYRLNTRGNRKTEYDVAKLKLSRDIALATVVAENDRVITYQYGSLFIGVSKERECIIDVHVEWMYPPSEVDHDKRAELNAALNLSEE